jgi:uncharacterized membrane protein
MATDRAGDAAAKQPISPIAGPYGHPFHPLLVTVPIGAWISSLVLDIATRAEVGNARGLIYASEWLIAIGIIGALIAAVFGLLDLLTIPRGTKAFRTGLIHLGLNLTVVALFAINFGLRKDDWDVANKVAATHIVLSVVALGLLAISGWLGGKLVYRFGVRVARETDQAAGFAGPPVRERTEHGI